MSTSAPTQSPASVTAPLSARRTATRDRLLAAATTVFAERGVNGASVEEVCGAAGFTRGAFYSNFADKDALVLALIEAGAAAQYAAAERAVAELGMSSGDLSPAERVWRTLNRFQAVDQPTREGVLAQRELLLHAARVPALHAPYTAFLGASLARLRDLIAEALAAAGLEFTLPFDSALELLVAAHDHVQTRLLFDGVPDASPLQALIMAVTRPAEGPQPAPRTS